MSKTNINAEVERLIESRIKAFEEKFKMRLIHHDHGRSDFIALVLNQGMPEEQFAHDLQQLKGDK